MTRWNSYVVLILVILLGTRCGKKNSTAPERIPQKYYLSLEGNDNNAGSEDSPWATFSFAIGKLKAGDILTVLSGRYDVDEMITISRRGKEDAWITILGETGETVTIDGTGANIGWGDKYPYNNGLIQIADASYIRIQNLTVRDSHMSGINIQDSDHIDILNCTTRNSLSPGIAAWQECSNIRVLGNTVINASDEAMSWDPFTGSEAPHEAISMAGPHNFEVAYNHVHDCKKEGIDVKETAAHGLVHHNYVHDCDRQGLYIDGWFGLLEDIEMHDNVVHGCEAGIAVSSEDGPNTKDLLIHHNLVYNNRATGIFFSRWGQDNPRENVEVYNNTFYRNGWGPNFSGDPNYWLSGGCYIYTENLLNVTIQNNIFARNKPFEIGYTERLNSAEFELKQIVIQYNLIQDINTVEYPFHMATWADDWVSVTPGEHAIEADPLFEDPANGDFRIQSDSPAINAGNPDAVYNDSDGSRNDIGAFPFNMTTEDFWWLTNFPPDIDPSTL
ncbi:right-handed parallel beta-helix repeat-containing protein [candidate division KSB1 bacterium]|nr:right-handed parallel beta-helix repeat-containing protein [candidate division KSB1 bacterium]